MTYQTRNFTIADPRNFDGTAFDVADRACAQASALAGILAESLEDEGLFLMLRNAELQREVEAGYKPDPLKWEDGPQAKLLTDAQAAVKLAQKKLNILRMAAGYDPKNPPKA